MNTNENKEQLLKENVPTLAQREELPATEQGTGLEAWIKANRKPLFFAAIGLAAVVGFSCGIRSRNSPVDLSSLHTGAVKQLPGSTAEPTCSAPLIEAVTLEPIEPKRTYTRPEEPFIRNMAKWKHHSLAKALQATELGIQLEPYQTLVDFSQHAA